MVLTGLSGLSSSVAWKVFMKDPEKQLDKFAKNKDVQKELDYFKKATAKAKTVDDLLTDSRAMKVLLSAYDLEDEVAMGMGRIKKVLTEDPTSSNALSAKLADSRFAAMAKDLRLDQSLAKLQSSSKQATITDKYIQSEFEQALGQQDPALREAAYFARNISTKAASVYSILGDKVVRDVVQSTLNLPAQLAIQSVETQARAVTSKLKIDQFVSDLKDAGGLTSSQITTAQQDNTLLDNNLKISDAAIKQVTSLQTAINKAMSDYDALAARTTAPAEVAAQQDAIPELLRFEQLLSSGNTAIGSVAQNIQKLQQVVTDASDPANSSKLASYKTKFASLVDTITSQLNNANAKVPTEYDVSTNGGTAPTENILKFSSNDVLTAKLKSDGTKNIDINAYNTDDLTAALSVAKSAFDNLSNSGDVANLATASNKLTSALNRSNAIQTSITKDTATLKDKLDDVTYGTVVNSADVIKAKRSIEDAQTRTKTIASLLEQISALAGTSADRVSTADRTDLTTQFNTLKTKLYDAINTPGASGLDNLLTSTGQLQYKLMDRPDGNGGTESVNMYVNGMGTAMQDIVTALDTATVGDQAGAKALNLKALQLTNRTDTATKSFAADLPVFSRTVANYDPKAKIDMTFFDLQRNLDNTINSAAVGNINLLSSDQSDISLAVSSSSELLKLRAAKTFKTDVASQVQNIIAQLGNGLTATKNAVSSLSSIVDRTSRFLSSDNRNLTFEQGRIGAVLDTLDPDTAEDGSSRYKVNSFTEKFITRYLTLNGSSGATFSASQAASLNLYSGQAASASSLLSLSMSI